MSTKRVRAVVIGAGAAGLISARHLAKAGVDTMLLERSSRIGGLWGNCNAPENPVYDSLRTNLPSSLMGLSDYSFNPKLPSFMPHGEVGHFLRSYAIDKDLLPMVKLRHTVTAVERLPGVGVAKSVVHHDGSVHEEVWPQYRVHAAVGSDTACLRKPAEVSDGGQPEGSSSGSARAHASISTPTTVTFDADVVVVCNGHFESPMVPLLPGKEHLRGGFLHSSLYRRPSQLEGRRVMVVGSGPSGSDVAVELLGACPAVWLATRDCAAEVEAADVAAADAAGLNDPPCTSDLSWGDPAEPALHPDVPSPGECPSRSGAVASAGQRQQSKRRPTALAAGPEAEAAADQEGQLYRCGPPVRVLSDGTVVTASGAAVRVETVVWCTGYRYRFGAALPRLGGAHGAMSDHQSPAQGGNGSVEHGSKRSSSPTGDDEDDIASGGFLSGCGVRVEDDGKRVAPLYLGLFQRDAPSLAVVGVPWRVNPFPLFEYQARLVARVATGDAFLPAEPLREEEEVLWARYVSEGLCLPPRFAHMLGGLQWQYSRLLFDMAGGGSDGHSEEAGSCQAASESLRACLRWSALLRLGISASAGTGEAASGDRDGYGRDGPGDVSLVDGPASVAVRSLIAPSVPASGGPAASAIEERPYAVPMIDVDAAIAASGGFDGGSSVPASTWGGVMGERLARDRAMYLNVSAARASNALTYRSREYRFAVRAAAGVAVAEPQFPAELDEARAEHTGEGKVEVHEGIVVALPEGLAAPGPDGDSGGGIGARASSPIEDTSSRLMATPF